MSHALTIRLLPDRRCLGGCAAPTHVEERTGLCLPCFHLVLLKQERLTNLAAKLTSTLASRFAVADVLALDNQQVEEAEGWRKLFQRRKTP